MLLPWITVELGMRKTRFFTVMPTAIAVYIEKALIFFLMISYSNQIKVAKSRFNLNLATYK